MKKSALRLERIREGHAQTDADLALLFSNPSNRSIQITCTKGCAACCSEPVYAERREAELAVQALSRMSPERQLEVKERVRTWFERVKAAPEILKEEQPHVLAYRKLGLPCPFLRDRECSIYADRPWGCRLHYAVGPRENCEDDGKRLSQTYAYVPNIVAQKSTLKLIEKDGGAMEMEHFGLLLAEILFGERVESAGRTMFKVTFSEDRKGNA